MLILVSTSLFSYFLMFRGFFTFNLTKETMCASGWKLVFAAFLVECNLQRKMSPLKFLPGKLRDFNGGKWLEVSSRLLFWWTICVYSEPFPNYVWEKKKKIQFVFPWQNVLPETSLSFIWVAKSTTGSENLVRTFFPKAANNFRAPGSQEDPFLCSA